jgi:predicted CXXCH cytochrome family protein
VAEGDCLACHKPHASEFPSLGKAKSPDLCTKCHDLAKPELSQKHLGKVGPTTDCVSCHAPHAAEGQGLFWPNRHKPFAEKKCEECHVKGK